MNGLCLAPPGWGLPTTSPEGIEVMVSCAFSIQQTHLCTPQAYIQWCRGLRVEPYSYDDRATAVQDRPVLLDGEHVVTGGRDIIHHLQKKALTCTLRLTRQNFVPSARFLSRAEQAECKALSFYVRELLSAGIVPRTVPPLIAQLFNQWMEDDNASVTSKAFAIETPFPLNYALPFMRKRVVRKQLEDRGMLDREKVHISPLTA
jgi:hypothetical protein